jgi:uncharacterized protein YciI
MLYAITLNYGSEPDIPGAYVDAHKLWLGEMIKKGHVIFAGPLQNKPGGFILATATDSQSLENEIERDPFVKFGLVSVDIAVIEPAICSMHFLREWAGEAKAL